jgi:hypothetical protein
MFNMDQVNLGYFLPIDNNYNESEEEAEEGDFSTTPNSWDRESRHCE